MDFLKDQIITYLGNKRSLLDFIGNAVNKVKTDLGKEKLDIADVFSGSGIVSRYFKSFANNLYTNDLEDYCKTINTCYLTNKNNVDWKILTDIYNTVKEAPLTEGFISRLYSPKDDKNIQAGERCFYTTRNAKYIDGVRSALENVAEPYKTLLLAPLLYEASVHVNTSGVFKGFYKNSKTGIGQFGGDGKNALSRIMGDIKLSLPILSDYNCNSVVIQGDANDLHNKIQEVDLAYMDPPYNQHPYASNYFMLNLINNYKEPTSISKVSGIPTEWNKSSYNKKTDAKKTMFDLCQNINAKYLLISFNSEGFISLDEMKDMLSKIGTVEVFDTEYNAFRGSRNLSSRDTYVKEFLYLVKKN